MVLTCTPAAGREFGFRIGGRQCTCNQGEAEDGQQQQGRPACKRNGANTLAALTDRERQIVQLVSEGLSNKEIGRRLDISDGTIKAHLHNIYDKLAINNRTALAALAISR